MNTCYFHISILDRAKLPQAMELYRENRVLVSFIALGRGTAPPGTLSLLSLSDSERAVSFSILTDETWAGLKKDLQRKLRIDVPGVGISFIIPVSAVGGKKPLRFLLAGQDFEKGEESAMKETRHELLLVICNQGCSETVMDAARSVGAAGGTIVHAQGTGMEQAERFLGISLASEKEMIFIVTRTTERNRIMQAVMKTAGPDSKAKAVIFSLPVSDTAGLRLLEEDEEPSQEKLG
jgi:nitrogen regulatory protein PII